MKRLAVVLVIALSAQALAWEAQTTQAGLAEQAALSSRLNKRLITLGFSGGLFEPLTIPPADAPALIADLKLLSPTHGAVPDARGRQTALAWISAGAALADVPAKNGANHFYDPATKQGWVRPDLGLRGTMLGLDLPAKGVPAPDWVTDKSNPFNLSGFLDQYAKSVTAATPGERSRAMAGALVAAGAMMHVLGDLGNPARVRGDSEAMFQQLGGGPEDLGSRFERIAALAYSRLGIPAPSRVITRPHLRDYFTSADGQGFADEIAKNYFSPNTLPEPTHIGEEVHPKLVRAQPGLPTRLNLMAASRDDGTTLRAPDGTCLARYRVEHGTLSFAIDDDCVLEQLATILPETVAYETGLLDFLLRGELTLTAGSQIVVASKGLGPGTVELVVEDDRGVRTPAGTAQYTGSSAGSQTGSAAGQTGSAAGQTGIDELARFNIPAAGTRVLAVFRGADSAGEPIVAVGALPLQH